MFSLKLGNSHLELSTTCGVLNLGMPKYEVFMGRVTLEILLGPGVSVCVCTRV